MRTSPTNRGLARRLAPLALAFSFVFFSGSSQLFGKDKPQALVVVSVFTAEGFALAGVPITVKRKEDRKPKWRGVTDRRGELAVRLPAGRGTYEVTTASKERKNETQTVEVYGEERVDAIFRLAPREDEKEQ